MTEDEKRIKIALLKKELEAAKAAKRATEPAYHRLDARAVAVVMKLQRADVYPVESHPDFIEANRIFAEARMAFFKASADLFRARTAWKHRPTLNPNRKN